MRSVKTNRLDCKTGVNRANKHSLALCSSMVQALSKLLKSELFLVFSDACVGWHCHIGVNEICSFRKSSRIHTSSYSKLVFILPSEADKCGTSFARAWNLKPGVKVLLCDAGSKACQLHKKGHSWWSESREIHRNSSSGHNTECAEHMRR